MCHFSVLMSVYFREQAKFLDQALESVLINQSLKPSELVLVADGQLTEELYLVINKYKELYSNFKLVQLPQNVGLGKALNEGLKHCSHELVARMDTDDICKPNRFEKQITIFTEHSEIDICSSWIDEFENDITKINSSRRLPQNHNEIYQYGKSRNPINHPAVMFKKDSVLKVGGYKHFPLFEDYYLWVRMIVNNAQFYNIPESLLYFRASNEMFNRRGGYSYVKTEIKFLWTIHKLGYTGLFITLKNICIRFTVRVLPNKIRTLIYNTLLR